MTKQNSRPAGRTARALVAILAVSGAIMLSPVPGARADSTPDLMGDWTVDPFNWQSSGCKYEQWVVIRKRTGPTTYTGVSRQRHTCFGKLGGMSETRIVITLKGKKVVLTSTSPSWNTEILDYISPYRMDGRDSLGHRMIYRRPKGPPGV